MILPTALGQVMLRDWVDDDRRPFAELNADPEVMRYFPAPLGPAESDALVDRIVEHLAREQFGLWAVDIGGRFAGFTGLTRATFDGPLGTHVEVGWRLARWAWGQGVATEAARAAITDGGTRCGITRVYSYTTVSNTRSRAVMKRLDMARRPDLDFDHPRTPGWWGQRHVVYETMAPQ